MNTLDKKTSEEFDKKFLSFRDPDIVDGFAKDKVKQFIADQKVKWIGEERERVAKLHRKSMNNFTKMLGGLDGVTVKRY